MYCQVYNMRIAVLEAVKVCWPFALGINMSLFIKSSMDPWYQIVNGMSL